MSSTRGERIVDGASTIVSILLIYSGASSLRPLGLDGSKRAMNLLHAALAFQVKLRVHLRVQIFELFFKLDVAFIPVSVERAARESFPHCASRLRIVTTITEVARGGNRFHVAESFAERASVP